MNGSNFRKSQVDYMETGAISNGQTGLLSVSYEKLRVRPVNLFPSPPSESAPNYLMKGDAIVTLPGHSTEASSPGAAASVQKHTKTFCDELLSHGTGEKSQQAAEEEGVRESNVESNSCSTLRGKNGREQGLSRRDFWFGVAVFILIGLNSLMAWNVMLNLAPYMAASYFDGQDYGNTFLACFQGTCVSVQIALIYFKLKPKTFFFYIGAAINVVAFLAITPAAAYCGRTAAAVIVHLICLFWGVASGILQGAGYAYAGTLPVNFAVFLSAGQGIAGLAAFALNTFLGFAFFDLKTRSGLTDQSWILYSVCAAFSAILSVCMLLLASRPWARQSSRAAIEFQKEDGRSDSSPVILRVEPGRLGSKLTGQKVVSNEVPSDQAGCGRSRSARKGFEIAEGLKDSREVWTDLLDTECSNETAATTARTFKPGDLKDSNVVGVSEQTPFSHPFRPGEDLQTVDAVRADLGEQPKVNLCEGAEYPKRNVLAIAKEMWRPLLAILTTFFVTLNLFPRIGPVGWHYTQSVPNHFVILFGLFSIADTLGRSTPSLQMLSPRWLGWTLIPERVYIFATFCRILFYIPFFLSYKLKNRVMLNDFWWLSCLILLFAYTHGWFTSLGFIYAVGKVPDSEKGTAGPLAVVALSLGVLLGLYIALAY